MNSRKSAQTTLRSVFSIFFAAQAKACSDSSEIFFKSPSNIDYEIIRQCNMGELSGGKYYDKAIESLASECAARFSSVVDVDRFDQLASWHDGGIELLRGRYDNLNVTQVLQFERCIKALFDNANAQELKDIQWVENGILIGIGAIFGLILLICFGCWIGGTISDKAEKEKKKDEAIQGEAEKTNQVEKVVIEPEQELPSEEFKTSSAMSGVSTSSSTLKSSKSESRSEKEKTQQEKGVVEKEIITITMKM